MTLARRRALLPLELLALAAILGALVVLLTRLLHDITYFDEGVYLVSLDDLHHGAALGRDVFTSQGPIFYVLLQALGAVFGVSVTGVRLGLVVVVALGAGGAYLLGRSLAGAAGGLLAAGMLTIAPLLAQYGGRIYADTPALSLAVVALWLVAARRPAPAGAVFAAAVLVKLSAFTAAPSLVALLLLQRPLRRTILFAAAGAAGLVAVFALVYVRDLGDIWSGSVRYHLDARPYGSPLSNTQTWEDYFWHGTTTPFIWLVAAGLIASVTVWREVWPLWLWPVFASSFLLEQRPLQPNHVLVMPYAFAIPAAVGLGLAFRRLPTRAVPVAAVVLALLLVAGWAQQLRRTSIGRAPEDPALIAAAAEVARVTGPADLVVSDQPIVAFLAHRRVPGDLVDTAALRFETGSLTNAGVLAEIDGDARITAAVVGRAFVVRSGLPSGIAARFEHRWHNPAVTIYYGRRTLTDG